jgi:hypothetical protein
METCDDVTEYGKYNPKTDPKLLKRKAQAKSSKLFDYKNPIPDQIVDTDDLIKLFEKLKLVPYAGDDTVSGQKLLDFFRYLRTYSDTHAACIESKIEYSYGGKAKVVYDTDDFFEFKDEEKEVPSDISKQFAQAVRTINWDKSSIRQFIENAIDPLLWAGNYYVELVHSQTAGVWSTSVYVHQPEHCLYMFTEPGEQNYIVISLKWEYEYLRKNPPKVLPVFPAYSREGNTYRTIIHEMHGNYPWYGRMAALGGVLPMYNETQVSTFMVKHADSNFMAQVLMEFEDGDGETDDLMDDASAQKAGFENAMDRFEQNYSARGDNPSSAIVTSRPYGTKPAFVHEFKPQTGENYYEKVSQINESKIIKSHNWSRRLMGLDAASGLSTNVFLDEFSIKNVTVIRKMQNIGNWLMNTIIKEAFKFSGNTAFEGISISLTSPLEEMLVQAESIDNSENVQGND